MTTVFISVPINELNAYDYQQRIADVLQKLGSDFVNITDMCAVSVYPTPNASTNDLMQILGQDLAQMAQAQCVCFAHGWEHSRHCRIVHECAVQYGMPILTEEDFVNGTGNGESA